MSINLSKGQKINLDKKFASRKLIVGLGWNAKRYDGGYDFDLDSSVFMCGKNEKCLSDRDFIFYNNPVHTSRAIEHLGDDRRGTAIGTVEDAEQIKLCLSLIPADCESISFVVTIYDAEDRRQNFGQVENAYIRIVDEETGEELIRYDLSEDFSSETALVVAKIYRHKDGWKFNAIGSGFNGGLAALCHNFGLDTE